MGSSGFWHCGEIDDSLCPSVPNQPTKPTNPQSIDTLPPYKCKWATRKMGKGTARDKLTVGFQISSGTISFVFGLTPIDPKAAGHTLGLPLPD